ncbi:deoxyguanosinetriphosphate triphosphohydrolase [Methylophilaceae bacterium]|jgi:dGTPase|nr:deoxyguanosinetriphosphate triphosphohydrolase [Methylophilaceae bacterium]
MMLKPYAADPNRSLGRQNKEAKSELRNDFQRDRDRIIHSSAFRRLEYKTQVFVNHEGDMFRTRLTHSLEVSQIARGIARTLNCHEDLAEAIALAHDLGHTPFGHAGQDSLNACMKDFGGFEHNLQSLRVVDLLEQRYADFDGLNLTFETREGILKHCSIKNAKSLGAIGERFIKKQQPSLEAQLVNHADEIAYNNHDIDDGYRSGLIKFKALMEVPLFKECAELVKKDYSDIDEVRWLHETIRRIMSKLIFDICKTSSKNLSESQPQTIDQVRILPNLINLSQEMTQGQKELKQFLRRYLYEHERVVEMTNNAKEIIKELFLYYINDPSLMPKSYQNNSKQDLARAVADYLAGMTDRYAIKVHKDIKKIS